MRCTRRQIALLQAMLVLAVGSSLTPITLWSSSFSKRSLGAVGRPLFVAQDISSYLSLALEKEPTSFHIAPSEIKAREPQEQKKTKIAKVESDDEKEFHWLNWVYCRWTQCPPGTIPPAVLKQMEPAISRWGRRKSLLGAERAEELLERLIEEYLLGNPHLDLSVSLFNSAMDAYAKVGNPQGVQRILRRMRELRRNHENETQGSKRTKNGNRAIDFTHLVPDVFSMSTLATAWAKSRSPEASAMVESILCYMETKDLVPNLITYNSVLHAISTTGGRKMDRGMRAQKIIDSMRGNGCEPDVSSYQMLIQAWSKTIVDNAPERAERILKYLEDEAYQGNDQLAANVHCYTAVIHAWTNSQQPEKARRAYELFGRMRKLYEFNKSRQCKPNVVIFTAVINACARPAHVSEKLGSFQIAQLTMEEALVLGEANFLTFAAFLGVCSHTLLPSTLRDGIVKRTFEQCRDAGQVGRIVLEKLKQAASPVLYKDLVGRYPLDGNELPTQLPKTWTKNIRGERGRPVPV